MESGKIRMINNFFNRATSLLGMARKNIDQLRKIHRPRIALEKAVAQHVIDPEILKRPYPRRSCDNKYPCCSSGPR